MFLKFIKDFFKLCKIEITKKKVLCGGTLDAP